MRLPYSCTLLPRKVFDLLLLRAPFYLLHWMLPDLNWFFSNKLLNFFVCLSLSSNSSVVRRRNWRRPWWSPGATSNQVKVLIELLELTAFLLPLGVIPLGSSLCDFCVRSFQTLSELFFFSFFLFSSDQIWIPARVRFRWTWKTRLGSRLDRVRLGNWSGSRWTGFDLETRLGPGLTYTETRLGLAYTGLGPGWGYRWRKFCFKAEQDC